MKKEPNKIKVAYIMTPVEFGGAEKVSINLLKYINRNIFEVRPIVFVRPWEKDNFTVSSIKNMGYEVYKIPTTIRTHSEGRGYYRFIRGFKIIFSILKKGRFNLVHSNGYFADIMSLPAAKLLSLPFLSTCHGYINTGIKLKIYNNIDIFFLRFSDKIFAVSKDIVGYLIKMGVKESKIIGFYNAIEIYKDDKKFEQYRNSIRLKYNISNKDMVIGYVGRLSDEKGIKYLFKASSMLCDRGYKIKVLVIGDGPLKEELESMAADGNLHEIIIFTGFIKDVEKYLASIDIFVLPSITEGTPMALLEAMAMGKPVIATEVGGVPNVVKSGKNGLLVPSKDSEKIGDAIQYLMSNKNMCEKISIAGKKTVEKEYSIEGWVKKIENEYIKSIDKYN